MAAGGNGSEYGFLPQQQALRTIVLETERYHARLGVAGTRKKGRVIKVLGDYGLSIEAGTFKNKRIRGILGEDIADADNIVPTRFKNSDGTRGEVMIGQVRLNVMADGLPGSIVTGKRLEVAD